jgi:hypothetical protein
LLSQFHLATIDMNSSTLSSTDKQQNGMDLTFLLSCAVLPLVVPPQESPAAICFLAKVGDCFLTQGNLYQMIITYCRSMSSSLIGIKMALFIPGRRFKVCSYVFLFLCLLYFSFLFLWKEKEILINGLI